MKFVYLAGSFFTGLMALMFAYLTVYYFMYYPAKWRGLVLLLAVAAHGLVTIDLFEKFRGRSN